MLALGKAGRVFIAAGASDLRKSFDTLAGLVRNTLGKDPLSGDLFIFCNGPRNRIKVLFWDRNGYWLCAKRLEKGTFAWSAAVPAGAGVELVFEELMLLLEGIDLTQTRRRRWYGRSNEQQNPE
jgi:transposase